MRAICLGWSRIVIFRRAGNVSFPFGRLLAELRNKMAPVGTVEGVELPRCQPAVVGCGGDNKLNVFTKLFLLFCSGAPQRRGWSHHGVRRRVGIWLSEFRTDFPIKGSCRLAIWCRIDGIRQKRIRMESANESDFCPFLSRRCRSEK